MKKKVIEIAVFLVIVGLAAIFLFSPGFSPMEAEENDNEPQMTEEQKDYQEEREKELAEKARDDAKQQEKKEVTGEKQIVWHCSTEFAGCPTDEWLLLIDADESYTLKIQNEGMEPTYDEGEFQYLNDEHTELVLNLYGEEYRGQIKDGKLHIMDLVFKKTHMSLKDL